MTGDESERPPASPPTPPAPPSFSPPSFQPPSFPPPGYAAPPVFPTQPGYGAPPIFPAPAGYPSGYGVPPGYAPGYPPVYAGYPAPGFGGYPQGYAMGYAPIVPGQPTRRINRATFGLLIALFWGGMFAAVGLGTVLIKGPSVPVRMADGRTQDLTSTIVKTGDGCELSVTTPQCVEFWRQRNVTPQQIADIDRAESTRLLFLIPVLPLIVPLVIGQVRRHHDCGRSGWMVLVNLVPCVGPIFAIVNVFQGGQPYVNQHGPPPKSGVSWRSLYGGSATS